jgi:hypothetical protein
MKHISIILLQVIQAIISFALPAAAVIGGYMIIAAFYLNAIEPGANIAFWLTAAKFVFVSPIYAYKLYRLSKTGKWGEKGSTFLVPLKLDVTYWGGCYLIFTIIFWIV